MLWTSLVVQWLRLHAPPRLVGEYLKCYMAQPPPQKKRVEHCMVIWDEPVGLAGLVSSFRRILALLGVRAALLSHSVMSNSLRPRGP